MATALATWIIDPVHSSVEFSVDYMGFSTYRTRFRALEGSLQFDPAQPGASSVTASIPVASVDATNDRLMLVADWEKIYATDALIVDVREPDEFSAGHVPRAINLPLSKLRTRFKELAQDKELWICCAAGQRAYFAARFLTQAGYRARNLSGGYTTYKALRAAHLVP